MGDLTEHFSEWEFDCRCQGCMAKGSQMQSDFIRKLQTARTIANGPFSITSGMRCEPHNQESGGRPNSSHLTGWAADIAVTNSGKRFEVLQALIEAGFTRIGVARTFIHADCDPDKAPRVCWLY